jgi:carboxyl-terminal processing protease
MGGKERVLRRALVRLAALVGCAVVVSCGGSNPAPYSAFANKCDLADEKIWLRGWTDDLYLWYREVPNVNPNAYATAIDYFNVLKTTALTSSGNPKDKFHFTIPTAQWQAFSQSGVEAGYGVQWAVVAPRPPRQVVVAFTDPNTPAAAANIARGAQVLKVDGYDLVNGGDPTPLNAGLFPANVNETHTFTIQDLGASTTRDVTLTSANITSTPVQNVQILPGTTVGYMLFNDHIATAENLLVQAVTQLKSGGATDLVLDIRYNGGGYLSIASELAYMISGPSTGGKAFETLTFNDKHPTNDPVTGQLLAPTPFLSTAQGFTTTRGTPLPTLGLSRVFVLTGGGTCSASESVINGLRGQGIRILQIGSTTCGKPYGFYPGDNCGTTYFSIQFKGVNAQGFGDYPDGFTPGTSDNADVLVGCQVADDFTHGLGDPNEARLAAALQYRTSQTCPPATFASSRMQAALSVAGLSDVLLVKSPWRENRIVVRER